MKPPEPIVVGLLTVHPEREPTRRDPSWWWRGYATISGERHKPTFGRGARADIERAAIQWMHDRATSSPRESKGYTVRDICELWLGRKTTEAEAGEIAPRSLLVYTAAVRRLISAKREGTLGDLLADGLDDDRVELYALARRAAGHAPKTINTDVSVLVMAFRYGRRKKWTTTELAPKPVKAEARRPTRTPTREEILTVMAALPPRYRLMLWLQYATGARVGEIAHLEWADIDLETREATLGLHVGAAKTGARVVTLPAELIAELQVWRARTEEPKGRGFRSVPVDLRERWVLGVTPTSAVSRMMKLLPKACTALPKGRITSHAIRRWVADELGRSGAEAATAASQLGHDPAMMLSTYRQPDAADRRKAVEGAQLGAVLAFRRQS